MNEGNAPGYPLGVGWYGEIKPVKVVNEGEEDENDEDDEEDDISSEGGLADEAAGVSVDNEEGVMVAKDGKGVPLYGRKSRILLGDK